MSRKSSFGYSSYGTHSYKSGSYHNRRKNKKKKIIIITVAILLVLIAAAVCIYFFFFNGKPDKTEESSAPQVSQVSEVSQSSQTSKEESKDESSEIADVSEDPNIKGYYDGNVFVYDKQGYEMFYGTESTAKKYAAAVSSIKNSLGNNVNVYNMVVPTHSAYGIPKSYRDTASDQKENIETIYSSYSADVKPINLWDTMNAHKNEYVYFRTDHNWTALGAYYGYSEFCKTAGINPVEIKTLSSGSIKNFEGALTAATKTDSNPKGNKDLLSNPDTVTYYNMPGDYTCTLLENGTTEEKTVPVLATFAEGSNAYSVFIWGDNPYMKIKTGQKTGKKLCIIKDSYGCALAPFTGANYDEIYVVDPRYYDKNIIDFIKKNRYTDVLVINSVMTANTDIRIKELKSIIS